MPEILEIEYYRLLAETALGREILSIEADQLASKRLETGIALTDIFSGLRFVAARRIGKLLVFDTEGPCFGLRFGMTGGLVVDGVAAIKGLTYGSESIEEKWVRARVTFQDGGTLALHDPRRLARVLVDPDEEALGPDALSLTLTQLKTALKSRGEGPALKARLLDQSAIAGIGNLLADEMLWRAALSPLRGAATLSEPELRRLHRHLRVTLDELFKRGGSHTGDHMEARHPGGMCPKDGQAFFRQAVGGRTTYWCPKHQS
jgi:formamidopyrimidine-DNA glycosylase